MPNDDYGDDMEGQSKMGGGSQEKDETALIPKTLLAGKTFNPGDELVLKVVHLYEDEVEVEYAHGDDKEEKSEGSEMDRANSKMESMGTTGDY